MDASRQHRAQYDDAGNIILNSSATPRHPLPVEAEQTEQNEGRTSRRKSNLWNITEADPMPRLSETPQKKEPRASTVNSTASETTRNRSTVFKDILREGSEQFAATTSEVSRSLNEVGAVVASAPEKGRRLLTSLRRAAKTPIVLHRKKSPRKPQSKAKIFFIDSVKFGGTFAAIFAVLFSLINYQSFLQIAAAELAIGNDLQTEEGLTNIVQGTATVTRASQTAFEKQGSLLAYLPAVGPFEDRIIIPKIGKNLPIVRPSMEALMREDWKQFENDIQTALHDGVVHYPGSAQAGQAGNFFLTAHSSYYFWSDSDYKDSFARLHELVPGDMYSVYYGGDKHVYRVIGKKEVKPTDVSVLDQPTDRRISTLMTCTPLGTTLRRLIVTAEEIDPTTGIALAVGEKTEQKNTAHFKKIEALPI